MYKRILSLVLCLALLLGICLPAGAAGSPITVKFDANGGLFPPDYSSIFGSDKPDFEPDD